MLRAAVLGPSLALAIATSAAAAPGVFHSPDDDGLPGVQTPSLTPGAHTLHLYIEGGATESSADPCFEGDGSELCGWLLEVGVSGEVVLDSFAPSGDAAVSLAPSRLRVVGGDAAQGSLGPVKIGDLSVHADGAGAVSLTSGKSLDTTLALQPLDPATLVSVPEPDAAMAAVVALAALVARRRRVAWLAALAISLALGAPARADLDADGIEDAQDVCPTRYDPGQEDTGGLDTASPDGVGDACQCGDVDGDGIADLVDVARLQRNVAALEPLAAPAKCPGAACDAQSVTALQQALADETPPETCAAATELGCFDSRESNESISTPYFLGAFSDTGDGSSFDAALPPGDEDWFSFDLLDDFGVFAPFAAVTPVNADYDVCLYIDCDDGSTAEVDCVAGSPASSNGLPGCCSTGTALGRDAVEATLGCGGIGSSEDSRIYLHVRRGATPPAGCGPYLLEFGG